MSSECALFLAAVAGGWCNRCSPFLHVLLNALRTWFSDKLSYLEKLRDLIRQKQRLDATLEEKSTAARSQAIADTALRAVRKFQKASPRFTRRREIASTLDVPMDLNPKSEVLANDTADGLNLEGGADSIPGSVGHNASATIPSTTVDVRKGDANYRQVAPPRLNIDLQSTSSSDYVRDALSGEEADQGRPGGEPEGSSEPDTRGNLGRGSVIIEPDMPPSPSSDLLESSAEWYPEIDSERARGNPMYDDEFENSATSHTGANASDAWQPFLVTGLALPPRAQYRLQRVHRRMSEAPQETNGGPRCPGSNPEFDAVRFVITLADPAIEATAVPEFRGELAWI